MIPFQITFRDFPESDAVWMAIQNRIEKLEHFFDRIIRCDVVISCPHHHRHSDRLFNVLIHIVLPGDDVVINRNPSKHEAHRDVYVAIRDAFDAAERVLEDRVRRIRMHTKVHDEFYQEGRISKLFTFEGYGFLEDHQGREIYFSQNSVVNDKFENLQLGQKVRFLEENGEKGPQVTSMAIV